MNPPVPQCVFTQQTFQDAFKLDISRACIASKIESAYVTLDGAKRFATVLEESIQRGVRTCIFVQKPEDWESRTRSAINSVRRADLMKLEAAVEFLRSLGAHVTLRSGTHLKLAVIDYKITWGGSLNILSYTQRTEEEIMRWTNEPWAMNTLKRRRFDQCNECLNLPMSEERAILALHQNELGKQIAKLRRDAGMSQEALARRIGTCRDTIRRLESGEHLPSGGSLIQIYDAIGRPLVSVPKEKIPILQRWLNIKP